MSKPLSGKVVLIGLMALDLRPFQVASFSLWRGSAGTEPISRFTAESLHGEGADHQLMRRSGKVRIVAELASAYGSADQDGARPASLRSLRFALSSAFPSLQRFASLSSDLRQSP